MKNRLVFVDLLRGWATIVMIEVHVFNAFILTAVKNEGWFRGLDYVNGLVAPAFLFVAGFVFVVASDRKLEEFRSYGRAFWRQLSRIGLVWVVGYGLHLPFFSLYRSFYDATPDQLFQFYQSDILHCIAIGMLIVFIGRIVIRRDEHYQRFLVTIGTLLVLVAPLIWDIDFSVSLPGYVAAYLNGQQRSMFPLFPWLGFLLFGAVTAFAHKKARSAGGESLFFRRLLVLGAVLSVFGSILVEIPARIPYCSTAIRANPFFFASRMGIILMLLASCWYYAERRKTERSFVLDVSRVSLLVYAAHLLVIYGRFWGDQSLAALYGGSFSVVECILATLGLILLLVVCAKVWGWLKLRPFPWARYVSYAAGLTILIIFLVRKY
jgi:uncharacterized membrane protein